MFESAPFFSLEGQTAIVTGGATGLGLGITRCIVGAGGKAIVIARSEGDVAALNELGDHAAFYRFDITDTDHSQEIVDQIISDHGNISILVNNAGIHRKKPIEEMTVEDFNAVLNVHLVGAFSLTKAVIPHMKANKKGSVLFQASMTSFIGQPFVAGYSTAKAGYLGLMRTLAAECGAFGVRVNAIAPGWIDTPMFHQATDTDPARMQKILGRIPMNTIGDPMDIGLAAVFLCSDAARYINGVCLPADGGALIGL